MLCRLWPSAMATYEYDSTSAGATTNSFIMPSTISGVVSSLPEPLTMPSAMTRIVLCEFG